MSHKARYGNRRPDRAMVSWCGTCEKRRYPRRKTAQAAAKTTPGQHLTAYECPAFDGWWHLGHMPRSVVQGREAKADFEARADRKRRQAAR